MLITIHDDAGPGRWALEFEGTREVERESPPTRVKLALILNQVAGKLLADAVASAPLEPMKQEPTIWTPGGS